VAGRVRCAVAAVESDTICAKLYAPDVRDEVLLALPAPIPKLRNVRSTLMLGSVVSLRAAGYGVAYEAAIPPEVREANAAAVAGMWIPIHIARAHYAACDRLDISADSAAQLGRATFARAKGLLLGTAIGLAKSAGVTPWTLMPYLQRFWLRGYDGGGVTVIEKGPKEAHLQLVECELLASHYFRAAVRGLMTGLFELTCTKAYMQERRAGPHESTLLLRAQWV
jgi:hypothetical protein